VIYISTACVKNTKIKNSVEELASNGFRHIELSGGTEYYDNFEIDLLDLKDKYDLNYLCHNYFPPPKKHFVLNLASLDKNTFNMSYNHLKDAISLSKRLGAKKFGFHAGFFIDIKVSEIGKKISRNDLFDQEQSLNSFCSAFKKLQKESQGIDLHIENNVFSKTNWETYNGKNPFMMTNYKDYKQLKELIDFNLLLDVAHLKVSSKTLSLDWEDEFLKMIGSSKYIHISDNDGFHDLNNQLKKSSGLFSLLFQSETQNKDFTLEVYENMDTIKKSYEILYDAVS